jgi:hypothetical protein
VLRFGFAKAKFTANVIYLQTLVVQAAQAVKADVLKVQQHSAVVATKEAANVVVNAEAATENKVVMTAEDQAVARAQVTNVVAEAVLEALTARVAQAAVVAVQAEIARVDQVRDNN